MNHRRGGAPCAPSGGSFSPMNVPELAAAAKAASRTLAASSRETRDRALAAMEDGLRAAAAEIFAANEADVAQARADGLAAPLLARLGFGEKKLEGVLEGIRSLRALPDPLGAVSLRTELAPGLVLERVSCPIGVVGVVFESRPDALVQISSLCLASGNACLLKGGREAARTNRALFEAIRAATEAAGAPAGWIALLESREDVAAMLACDRDIDLLIPRGSNAFVRHIQESTRIPVMGHSSGLCHLYLDASADPAMAAKIAVDAKTQAPSTCNTVETLLVHRDAAAALLPPVCAALAAKGVALRGDAESRAVVPSMDPATDADWDEEYLDLVLSVRVVGSLEEAVAHVNAHGSHHTDAIVAEDRAAAERFIAAVDSADVFWNCSTRFADGFRFGLGAEVGISTGKLPPRGPVGLDGLCTCKWVLRGSGDTVGPFADGDRRFTHKQLPLS